MPSRLATLLRIAQFFMLIGLFYWLECLPSLFFNFERLILHSKLSHHFAKLLKEYFNGNLVSKFMR